MDTVSSSDYLAVKKQSVLTDLYQEANSSNYTKNKQYLTLQTTPVNDSFGDPEQAMRFLRDLPFKDIALLKPKLMNGYTSLPMFVIPRIQVEQYVKNRYVKPFCWNCPHTVSQICSFCNTCTYCDLLNECEACEQTRFFQKTGMFFMERQ